MASPLRPLHAQLQDGLVGELTRAATHCARDVHDARKHCKKLRGVLRLLRGPLGSRYGDANRAVRDAARLLAGRREHQVAVSLCATLEARFPDSGWQRVAGGLDRPADDGDENASDRARTLLDALRADLEAEPLPPLTPEDLAEGLLEGYRRARRGLRNAQAHPAHPAALHEWRKDAKYHMHQVALLAPLWPALKSRRKRLARLCDALGDHHDRHDLALWMARMQGGPAAGERSLLHAQLQREQERLAARALRQGERCFARGARTWWRETVAGPVYR